MTHDIDEAAYLSDRAMYWALRNWLQAFAAQWGSDLVFYAKGTPRATAWRVGQVAGEASV